MIKTIIIDPALENEFASIFFQMDFKQVDRYLTGGQMSPVILILSFEGYEKDYHEEYYFKKNSHYYSLAFLSGYYATDDEQFIDVMKEVLEKPYYFEIKRIYGKP